MAKTEDRPSLPEQLARAAHSGDLSHRRTTCDVDYMHGLGMAGKRHRHGTSLIGLNMTLDPATAREAMKSAIEITRNVAKRRGWPMTSLKARRIGREALVLYLKPVCSACKGRSMLGMDIDRPDKAERVRPCTTCGGSGKRPPPLKHRREIVEVLYVMESRTRSVMERVCSVMRIRAPVD